MSQENQTKKIVVLRGDHEMHVAAAETLLSKLDGIDADPISRLVMRRMLEGVRDGVTELGKPKQEPSVETLADIAKEYRLGTRPSTATPVAQKNGHVAVMERPVVAPKRTGWPETRLDGEPWSKYAGPLWDSRKAPGSPCVRGFQKAGVAAFVAEVADGDSRWAARDRNGLHGTIRDNQYDRDIDLFSLLPFGDARMAWMRVRFGVGLPPGSMPDTDTIAAVTRALEAQDVAQACRVLGVKYP